MLPPAGRIVGFHLAHEPQATAGRSRGGEDVAEDRRVRSRVGPVALALRRDAKLNRHFISRVV
jgi:hypothetical protein